MFAIVCKSWMWGNRREDFCTQLSCLLPGCRGGKSRKSSKERKGKKKVMPPLSEESRVGPRDTLGLGCCAPQTRPGKRAQQPRSRWC